MAIDQTILIRMMTNSWKDLEGLIQQLIAVDTDIARWTEDDMLYKAMQAKCKSDLEAYVLANKISIAFYNCPVWLPNQGYDLGYVVKPTVYNGYIYECTTSGTSGGAEPAWPTLGNTVDDNGVIWTCREMGFQTITGYGTSNLTFWWLGLPDPTPAPEKVFYSYLYGYWDGDTTILEYIADWDIIYPLINDSIWGTTAMLSSLNSGRTIINNRKTQIQNRNPILGDFLTFTVTASVIGGNGSINPSGDTIVESGEDSDLFSMIPDGGYVVDEVIVDAISVGAVTSYIFSGVTEDHTIAVKFRV